MVHCVVNEHSRHSVRVSDTSDKIVVATFRDYVDRLQQSSS
jgi:hypothetical protein